jgi:putative NIF3 family GTP cyclohydrolase 1 type 2
MKVSALLAEIDRLAPFQLAEPWDRVGLQVGGRERQVGSVLVALDLTDGALDEAARVGADLLLVHHPPLFAPLDTLTDDTPAGAVVLRAAREGRCVVACHTNLDKAAGGLADIDSTVLGLEGVAPIAPSPVDWLKLVGFVPADDLAAVRSAVFSAGAGVIGNYQHCSFYLRGTGTFHPLEGAQPAAGKVGEDNSTGELRLEVVFPRDARRAVLDAYVAAHSYEEPAYDVYPV